MQVNPPILLIDTNVWLDFFLPHRSNYKVVENLLYYAELCCCSLAYPSHAVLDIFQKVRSDNKEWIRKSRPLTQNDALAIKQLAWDYVNQMRSVATAVPVDSNDIMLACKFRDTHDDLEDDLVLAACMRSKANYLVTGDKNLLTHAPIEAHTPADMLELIRTGRAKGTPVARDAPGESEWLYRFLAQYE